MQSLWSCCAQREGMRFMYIVLDWEMQMWARRVRKLTHMQPWCLVVVLIANISYGPCGGTVCGQCRNVWAM